MVGGFIAHVARYSAFNSSSDLREAAGFVGISLIIIGVITLDHTTSYPGYPTLLPVAGTALILLCATSETIVGRALNTKVLVGFGLISYSIYLWHQPIFVFSRYIFYDNTSWILIGALLS